MIHWNGGKMNPPFLNFNQISHAALRHAVEVMYHALSSWSGPDWTAVCTPLFHQNTVRDGLCTILTLKNKQYSSSWEPNFTIHSSLKYLNMSCGPLCAIWITHTLSDTDGMATRPFPVAILFCSLFLKSEFL